MCACPRGLNGKQTVLAQGGNGPLQAAPSLDFFINIRYEKHPGRMRTGLRQRCLFFYAQRAPLNSCPEIMKKPLVKTEKF